jgi:hypothetical protein
MSRPGHTSEVRQQRIFSDIRILTNIAMSESPVALGKEGHQGSIHDLGQYSPPLDTPYCFVARKNGSNSPVAGTEWRIPTRVFFVDH